MLGPDGHKVFQVLGVKSICSRPLIGRRRDSALLAHRVTNSLRDEIAGIWRSLHVEMPQVGPTPLREPGRRTCSLTSSDIDYPNPEMTLKGRNWKALHKRSTLAVDKLWMGIAHAPFPAWNSRGEPSIDTKTFFFVSFSLWRVSHLESGFVCSGLAINTLEAVPLELGIWGGLLCPSWPNSVAAMFLFGGCGGLNQRSFNDSGQWVLFMITWTGMAGNAECFSLVFTLRWRDVFVLLPITAGSV